MSRTLRSAKAAGTTFETDIARYLATALDDDRIERRAKSGAKDRGDIAGVRTYGQRLVIECKNCGPHKDPKGEGKGINLPAWTREAAIEAGNDDALVGVVIHKRHRVSDPAQQWVSMTVADLVALITGEAVA